MATGRWLSNYLGGNPKKWLPNSTQGKLRLCNQAISRARTSGRLWVWGHEAQLRELIEDMARHTETASAAADLMAEILRHIDELSLDKRLQWVPISEVLQLHSNTNNEQLQQMQSMTSSTDWLPMRRGAERSKAGLAADETPAVHKTSTPAVAIRTIEIELGIYHTSISKEPKRLNDTWLRVMRREMNLVDPLDAALLMRAYVAVMLVHYIRHEFIHVLQTAYEAGRLLPLLTPAERENLASEIYAVYLYRSVVYRMLNMLELARIEFERAKACAQPEGWHIDLLITEAGIHYQQWKFRKAYHLYDSALELLYMEKATMPEADFNDTLLRVEMGMGMTLKWLHDYTGAHRAFAHCAELCRLVKDAYLTAYNELQTALLRAHEYNRAGAQHHLSETLRLLQVVDSEMARARLQKYVYLARQRLDAGQLGPGEYTV